MRSKAETVALGVLRVILLPVALMGILCIWLYVLGTLGFSQANGTIAEILEL